VGNPTPVRYFIPTPVPSPGATGQAGHLVAASLTGGIKISPRYDFPNLPMYDLPDLQGMRGPDRLNRGRCLVIRLFVTLLSYLHEWGQAPVE
jgi:hypothetical protein